MYNTTTPFGKRKIWKCYLFCYLFVTFFVTFFGFVDERTDAPVWPLLGRRESTGTVPEQRKKSDAAAEGPKVPQENSRTSHHLRVAQNNLNLAAHQIYERQQRSLRGSATENSWTASDNDWTIESPLPVAPPMSGQRLDN